MSGRYTAGTSTPEPEGGGGEPDAGGEDGDGEPPTREPQGSRRNLLGRIMSARKKDVRKAEERVEEIVDEALGRAPARGPALADDED